MEQTLNDVSKKYGFNSGNLVLDFANTLDWHASATPIETILDYADLTQWGYQAGILTSSQAEHLVGLSESTPEFAKEVHNRAILLREAVYRIFRAAERGDEAQRSDIEILNEALSLALVHLQVQPEEDKGFQWVWAGEPDAPDRVLWHIARQAAELLTSDSLDRVRQCEDDRGCGYLFIDTTRNRSRRWCSMESCGNRAKARRHYQRTVEKNLV
jgi:predicted RNA-binding Zn ribbon-like protein